MNENPHEVLGKSPFSDESQISNRCEAREDADFQEDLMMGAYGDGRLPKKFQWMKGYQKEVRDVLGELVQSVQENECLGLDGSETPFLETTISLKLPEVGTIPLRHLLPPPGNSLRKLMQEVEYAQQKEVIEEHLTVSAKEVFPVAETASSEESVSTFQETIPVSVSGEVTPQEVTSQEVSSQEVSSQEVPPIGESCVDQEVLETPVSEIPVESLAAKISTPSSRRRIPRLIKEMTLGLVLGLLMLVGFSFSGTPVEDQLREALLGEYFSEVAYQPSEKSLLPDGIHWKDVEWTPAEGEAPNRTILAESLTAEIQPLSWVYGPLRVEKLTLRGIRFPLLQTVSKKGSAATSLLDMVGNNDEELDKKMASLQSLVWIEETKGRYLPSFEKMSARLEVLEKNASEIRQVMEQSLQQESEPNPETALLLERLAEIRQESDELQKQWKETGSDVAQTLSQVSEKISADGKDLAKILQGEGLTKTSLETFLYDSETSRQLEQILAAGHAMETLIQMARLPNEVPPEALETSGEIELCGQIFHFSGTWNTQIQEDCLRSFYGTMALEEVGEKGENRVTGSLMLSCRQKKNLVQQHVTARIPLGMEEICLGNRSEPWALYSDSQHGELEVEFDLFDNEIQGTMRITRNEVNWQCQESAPQTFRQAIAQCKDRSLVWEVALSGTLEKPVFRYTQTPTEKFLPIYAKAIQESTQQKRAEVVKQIYGKLKNAETTFNSVIEPYYQKMSASTENIMKIHERLAACATSQSSVAPVTIADIRLDTSEEEIEGEIPMFDPTLGAIEETANAVGMQVKVNENLEKMPVAHPSSQTRFVPVKKVATITPTLEETSPPTPVSQTEKKNALEITPMEATFFANSKSHAAETPLVTKEMTAPHGPLPLPIRENAVSPAVKNPGVPNNRVPHTTKPPQMPVPAMRSTTQFGT